MEQRLILVNLLIKLGVAAAVASVLVRSVEFKSLLFRESRALKHRIYLILWIGVPMALGVWVRFIQTSFLAGDLSFETTVLLGVIGGRFTGMVGGTVLALPALLHGEWATLPFNLLVGFVAGQLRTLTPDREDIWSFSPFIDLSIYRMIRRNLPTPRLFDWQTMFFVTIVALRFVQTEISRFLPSATFSLESPNLWVEALIYATSVTVIGIELKIWNSVRIQIKLEEQERLLLQSRMEALQNQINPHFLFNTLNSVSSLVRFDPDTARELIIKLATILRKSRRHPASQAEEVRLEQTRRDPMKMLELLPIGNFDARLLQNMAPALADAFRVPCRIAGVRIDPQFALSHRAPAVSLVRNVCRRCRLRHEWRPGGCWA